MAEVDGLLSVVNPELVQSFEEAERIFSLEREGASSSHDATMTDTEDSCGDDFDDETPCTQQRRTEDDGEDTELEAFFTETCKCTLGKDSSPCSQAIPRRFAADYRDQCLELSKAELDMAVLGQLSALCRREPVIAAVCDLGRNKKRRVCHRPYTVF